jgi:hypothetical protein
MVVGFGGKFIVEQASIGWDIAGIASVGVLTLGAGIGIYHTCCKTRKVTYVV